jgi:arylsulfatase A-like enzyme
MRPERKYRDAKVGPWGGNPAVFEEDTPGGRTDKPPYVQAQQRTLEYGQYVRERQYRTLMSVDDMVHKLYRTINDLDEQNTIAFFLSDNGLMWADHGLEGKGVPYTDSVHAPFLAKWPGHIPGGSIDPRIVANIDISPTVLDAVDIPPPATPMDGRSLLDDAWVRDRILLEYYGPDHNQTVPPWASTRTLDYQYIEYYDDQGATTFREYYDLVNDPWQLENLLGDGDPANDPPAEPLLQQQLQTDRSCQGTDCP